MIARALPVPRRRSVIGVALAGALVLSLVFASLASANGISPEDGGSPNANDIHTLFLIVLAIGAVIFLLVEGMLIYSADVAHSWWIPSLGGKADASPGHNNYTWFKISKPGIYHGQCAELCGNNHADMRAEVRAVPPDQFQAWVTKQRLDILASQQALAAARKAGQGS